MSERSRVRERSEQGGASEQVSGASEGANGRASGPVLTSQFLAVLPHCAETKNRRWANPEDWPGPHSSAWTICRCFATRSKSKASATKPSWRGVEADLLNKLVQNKMNEGINE